jgi:hypothetical protein
MSTGRTIVPKCWYFGETGVELKPEKFPFNLACSEVKLRSRP